jgi:hypothetical protein
MARDNSEVNILTRRFSDNRNCNDSDGETDREKAKEKKAAFSCRLLAGKAEGGSECGTGK